MERQNSEDNYNLILGGEPNLIRESRILSEFSFISFIYIFMLFTYCYLMFMIGFFVSLLITYYVMFKEFERCTALLVIVHLLAFISSFISF